MTANRVIYRRHGITITHDGEGALLGNITRAADRRFEAIREAQNLDFSDFWAGILDGSPRAIARRLDQMATRPIPKPLPWIEVDMTNPEIRGVIEDARKLMSEGLLNNFISQCVILFAEQKHPELLRGRDAREMMKGFPI